MPGIKDILQLEKARSSPADWLTIHLFQEGTFYRAYEGSAWLCCQHLNAFKVTHRAVKNIEGTIAFIGFPVISLHKWVKEGMQVLTVGEKQSDVRLPESLLAADATAESVAEAFGRWKSELPVSEAAPDKKAAAGPATPAATAAATRPTGSLFAIAQRILAYPIESKSPIENLLFLSEIRQQLAAIL